MKRRIAIIGTGIAGLGCGYFLHPHADITLYEQNAKIGGHTNTITVEDAQGQKTPIDIGFMVYNTLTYPNLTRFFADLDVPVQDTDMSFSVQHLQDNLEWCGSGLNHLFAQRRNLVRPRYWRMLLQLDRFNKDAVKALNDPQNDTLTIAQYVERHGYGQDFLHWFLIPMSAAIWSTQPDKMLHFPARTLLRFFHNHGFLGMRHHLQWKTVVGGSQAYIHKLMARLGCQPKTNQPVVRVRQEDAGVTLVCQDGTTAQYDAVILACHADQALAMLDAPSATEQDALGWFAYERNVATLHTDTWVMPRRKLCWASWNYEVAPHPGDPLKTQPATHYWMNNLQHIAGKTQYFVSINAHERIDPEKILERIDYEHPIFSVEAIAAQSRLLPALNRQAADQRIFFCGSYFKYGFHEDAFTSALDVSRIVSGQPLWQ